MRRAVTGTNDIVLYELSCGIGSSDLVVGHCMVEISHQNPHAVKLVDFLGALECVEWHQRNRRDYVIFQNLCKLV